VAFGYLWLCLLLLAVGDLIPPPPWGALSDPVRGWRVLTFMVPQAGLFTGTAALLQRRPGAFWVALLGSMALVSSRFLALDGGGGAWPHLLVRLIGSCVATGALWRGFLAPEPASATAAKRT
jgi:hypothetical protein